MSSTPWRSGQHLPGDFHEDENVLFGAEFDARPRRRWWMATRRASCSRSSGLAVRGLRAQGQAQQAIMVRRFFLDETGTDNVMPIISAS
jgi:hypothetical protein